jgi:2-keto-4-pentenoate hydratase/2-oxohepta-3-ene-1,7-dioic acid hydratase in catechol pathway
MRFARIGEPGQERDAAWDGQAWRDISALTADRSLGFIGLSDDAVSAAFDGAHAPSLAEPFRFGAPLRNIGKIVCIGLNYRDHARETNAAEPAEPIMFMKAPDIVTGPNDDVLIPRNSVKTDWGIELGVVIGAQARYLPNPDQALSHVAGYLISHDVSEREFQIDRGGQWDKGKNCETFNPLGPWFVTADEVANPQDLIMRLRVNGDLRQHGTTADMIFGVSYLVWYLSQFMVLYPGDVINTGTSAGVALGRPGTPYLRPGDVVALEIDGLGRQQQTLAQA